MTVAGGGPDTPSAEPSNSEVPTPNGASFPIATGYAKPAMVVMGAIGVGIAAVMA